MNAELMVAIVAVVSVFLIAGNGNDFYVNAEKCKDIKYEDDPLKMPGASHDDNKPSEKKFEKMVFGSSTICEVAFCYDNDDCKGELESHQIDEFKESIVYEGASEDQQQCLDHRYKLPDGGEKALQAYELFDCAVGNY